MPEPILTALLPDRLTSAPARRAGIAALLLFPVALIAGFILLVRNTPPSPISVTTGTLKAIEIARAFLLHEGIPAGAWSVSSNVNTDNDLLSFVNAKPDRIGLWSIAPPIFATVVFRSRAGDEMAHVYVSLDGKVVGFSREKPDGEPANPGQLSDQAALSLATARLPAGIHFGAPSVEKEGSERVYSFPSSAIPGAETKADVTVQGSVVTSFRITAKPNDDVDTGTSGLQMAASVCGAIFLSAVVIFSIYRYASRTLQQEVSHRRSLTVALLCGCFCVLLGFNALANSDGASVPLWMILVIFAIMGMMGGALVAAAYGSGEGDVREAFPGKLTSLDALLTGRLFSRNTGVSILAGIVCAGWLLLALALVTAPFGTKNPQGSESMSVPLIHLARFMPFVTYPLMSLCFATAGLMQPLAFLQRYVTKKRRWHMPVLIVCAGLVSTLRTHSPSNIEFLATSAIFVVALIVPFFLFDLLAAMVCTAVVFSTVGMAVNLGVAPAFSGSSLVLHIVADIGAFAFAVVCVWRGRTFSESEVRPLYARHIEERKSLEAEVSAAREAQLRLLPDSLPSFAGLDIAAACVPAETVGGDFYDFLPLGDGRLGVFIAEGNNRGLAAALTIALAKGYLMQCVERFHEPVEILTRLEAVLSSIFDKSEADSSRSALTDFAFAAIDTTTGQIRYARTGTYPKVVIVSSGGVVASERMIAVKGRRTPISEGRASLSPGDHVVLFTDGLGRRLAAGNRRPEDSAATLISRMLAQSGVSKTADEIRAKFFTATKASLEHDDLTLVVIQVHALAQLEETVALRVVA